MATEVASFCAMLHGGVTEGGKRGKMIIILVVPASNRKWTFIVGTILFP